MFAMRSTRNYLLALTARRNIVAVESSLESRAHRSGRSLGSLAINSEHFTRGNAGHYVQLRCSTALVRRASPAGYVSCAPVAMLLARAI